MVDENELLFFDTFSHETGELNLDLVQFPRPVYIHEIRIIPLGARVQADFPGGHRLGATNPSAFQLEFFVNDLSKRGACTFEPMGGLEYKQNVDIQFVVSNKIPTDGLVIRGWYSTVTLAIYGVLTKLTKERPLPPSPPPPTSKTPIESKSPEFDQPNREPVEAISSNWERPLRSENILEQSQSASNSNHPHHNPDPRRQPDTSTNNLEQRRPNFHEEGVYHERRLQSTSSPTNSRYTYTKQWTAPAPEEGYRKKTDYENPEFEGSFHHRTRSPLPHPESNENYRRDNREKEKDREVHDFVDDRRLIVKEKRRETETEVISFSSRDEDWTNNDTRLKEGKDYDRLRRERPVTAKDTRTESRLQETATERKDTHKRPPSPLSPARTVTNPKTPSPLLHESNKNGSNISEGYNSENDLNDHIDQNEEDQYEEILSEEEDMSDGEDRNIDLSEMEYDIGDETWNFTSNFNPFQCELADLPNFQNPGMTAFERNREKCKLAEQKDLLEESQKLFDILKQFADKECNEKWVEAVENLTLHIECGLSSFIEKDSYESTLNTILELTDEGLNYNRAINQPQTPFKVRHLKAGIKLATSLFQTDDSIVEKMLLRGNVKQLLDLYSQPYMTLPVKLLIIRALDAATFTSKGLKYFLNEQLDFEFNHKTTIGPGIIPYDWTNENVDKKFKKLTGYQRLWDIMLMKEPSRVVVTLKALINKLHTYEVLMELKEAVEKIAGAAEFRETTPPTKTELDCDSASLDNSDNISNSVANGDVLFNKIINCFVEITETYVNANKKIAQFIRYLPAISQFDTPKPVFDPYPCLYRMFTDCQLLECIFVLSSNPLTSIYTTLVLVIKELLTQLLLKNSGLKFLLCNARVTNGLQRALFQAAEETREENGDDSISNQLALNLVCTLQAFQHVDSLFAYHQNAKNSNKDLDDPETVASLHNMYAMTFSPIGKIAVINVLAMEQNLDSLLPFVELKNSEEIDAKLSKTVCCGYATELIILTVHHSDNLDLLQNFGERITQLSSQTKLTELSRWMCPIKKNLNYNYESISYLVVSYVKKYAQEAATLPPELITALRILENIVIPSYTLQEGNNYLTI